VADWCFFVIANNRLWDFAVKPISKLFDRLHVAGLAPRDVHLGDLTRCGKALPCMG
jgi:hypothetical protein